MNLLLIAFLLWISKRACTKVAHIFHDHGELKCESCSQLIQAHPNQTKPNQTKTNWTVCEIHLNMHSTISTLCISISHLVTKSRTIFRCIWMQYVCACACVCNVYSVLYILWIVIFLWSFVCSLYAVFHWKANFPFSFFSFLFVCCESNKASQNLFSCVIVGVLRVLSLLHLQTL